MSLSNSLFRIVKSIDGLYSELSVEEARKWMPNYFKDCKTGKFWRIDLDNEYSIAMQKVIANAMQKVIANAKQLEVEKIDKEAIHRAAQFILDEQQIQSSKFVIVDVPGGILVIEQAGDILPFIVIRYPDETFSLMTLHYHNTIVFIKESKELNYGQQESVLN